MRNIEVKRLEPKELEEFQREVDDLLDLIRWRAGELFAQHGTIEGRDLENWLEAEREFVWTAPAELIDAGREFRIRVAVPGFAAEQLTVKAAPDFIVIEGEKQQENQAVDGDVVFGEFGQRQLFRRIPLASPVDVSGVSATLENGELRVTVPKKATTEEALAAAA